MAWFWKKKKSEDGDGKDESREAAERPRRRRDEPVTSSNIYHTPNVRPMPRRKYPKSGENKK